MAPFHTSLRRWLLSTILLLEWTNREELKRGGDRGTPAYCTVGEKSVAPMEGGRGLVLCPPYGHTHIAPQWANRASLPARPMKMQREIYNPQSSSPTAVSLQGFASGPKP